MGTRLRVALVGQAAEHRLIFRKVKTASFLTCVLETVTDWLWVWLVSQPEIRNRLAGSPWERFLTHQVALYSPLSKVCSRPLMFFFIALSIFRPCVRARAKKRAADERAASAIWVERSSSTKSF